MKITVYTTSGCQFSKQEKDYLASHNFTYEEKNLEANREFLTEMLAVSNNFAGTPVTKIENDDGQITVLKGFTKEEFDQALGTTPVAEPTPLATEPVVPPVVESSPPTPPPAPEPPVVPVEPVVEPIVSEPQPPPVPTSTPTATPPPAAPVEPNPLQNILSDLETKASEPAPPTPPNSPPPPTPTPPPPTIPDIQV